MLHNFDKTKSLHSPSICILEHSVTLIYTCLSLCLLHWHTLEWYTTHRSSMSRLNHMNKESLKHIHESFPLMSYELVWYGQLTRKAVGDEYSKIDIFDFGISFICYLRHLSIICAIYKSLRLHGQYLQYLK
jgi:hypothetical protein